VPASPGTTSATTPPGSTEGDADANQESRIRWIALEIERRGEAVGRLDGGTHAEGYVVVTEDGASGDSAAGRRLLVKQQG
jgi:hypothetical protein